LGKKEYDKKRSETLGSEFGADFAATTSNLNYAPYSAPNTGYNKSNASMQESNPLFQTQEVKPTLDAVNVQNVKKVWGQAPAPVDNKMDSHYNSTNNLNVVSNPAN
jgi:hypothetical protein